MCCIVLSQSLSMGSGAADENVLGTHIDLDLDESAVIAVPIKAGDVSIHSSRLVHGSDANRSGRCRRGLTVSYMPASMRVVAPSRPPHQQQPQQLGDPSQHEDVDFRYDYLYLLRGSGVAGVNDGSARNFSFNPRPIFDPSLHMPFSGMQRYGQAPKL